MRAVSLSLSTIIVMIVLVVTLLSVIFFITGGFSEAGGSLRDMASGAKAEVGASNLDPAGWLCEGKTYYICEKPGKVCDRNGAPGDCPHESVATTEFVTYAACTRGLGDVTCWDKDENKYSPGSEVLECKCI